MKPFRIIVIILFALTTVASAYLLISEWIKTDRTIPEITVKEDMIEVSLKATDEELLNGVTAYDEKDKDLTDKVVVESISRFIEKGVSKVTYFVCDSNNNVAKATRLIKFSEYESPKFQVEGNLCFSLYERIDISKLIKATDSLEGDISSYIVVTSSDYTTSIAGAFSLDVSVVNQKGDTSIIKLPLIIEDRPISVPQIELKEYLVYTKVGKTVDFKSYIVDALGIDEKTNLKSSVRIESSVDFDKPGTYYVHYYVTDRMGNRGHSVLTVIVEE
ncbi:MAG: DUF5011 domain-containing protein [Clostridia bacterium]|nr:DUF5011 domain-containing protein [Clostridia bacterium]